MGFPFAFHENFESGNKGTFTTESDSGNRLDFPGPQQFKHDMLAVFPHKGGYCMRVNLGKNSTDAYVSYSVSWAADATNYLRFEFMVGEDVQVGNDGDYVDIMEIDSGALEGALTLTRIEPAGLVIGLRDTGGSVLSYLKVEPGNWVCIEAQFDVDAGAGNDGSIIVWRGDERIRLGNLDQAAMTSIRFGAIAQSGDFTGHIYFDEIILDDARLYPDYSAHNLHLDWQTMPMFKSGFAFVGQGTIQGVQLIDGGSGDCAVQIYDTDDVSYAEHHKKEHLTTRTASTVAYSQSLGAGQPLFHVQRGAYVALSGTNPQVLIRMGSVDELALADIAAEMAMNEEPAEATE